MTPSARAGAPADAINMHASAVVLGDRGVLITGPSGAGKTVLALDLIAHWRRDGRHAALLADDQVFVAARSGRLACFAPANIAGLAEVRGFGPAAVAHADTMIADLMVELAADIEEQHDRAAIVGIELPRLLLPRRDSTRAVLAIKASLALFPFR